MKLGIVGTGQVGVRHCASCGDPRRRARDRARQPHSQDGRSGATDMRYGTPLCDRVEVKDTDYDGLKGAGMVGPWGASIGDAPEGESDAINRRRSAAGVTLGGLEGHLRDAASLDVDRRQDMPVARAVAQPFLAYGAVLDRAATKVDGIRLRHHSLTKTNQCRTLTL
jgi:hypothetical protein